MLIKICGIKTIEAAYVAASAGANLLGFIFAPSKRRISPELAAEIAISLPPSIQKVGVFVNESAENIERITKQVGLDFVQLHGDELPELAKQLSAKVIRAFSIDHVGHTDIQSFPCDYLLIDSPGEAYRGGSGKTFNWNLLEELQINHNKVILAGGLSTENVHQAINSVRPAGVDVSSGVETNGEKDHCKINNFIKNARKAQHAILVEEMKK